MLTILISIYVIFSLITFFLLREKEHLAVVAACSLLWFLAIPLLIVVICMIVVDVFAAIFFSKL